MIVNLSIFNLISINSGFAILVSIGLLIYYTEHRWYKKDTSKSITEYTPGRVEITESVKGGRNSLLIVIFCALGFWIFVTVVLIMFYEGIEKYLILIIIWIINGPFFFIIYRKFLKGTSGLRQFIITDSFIKILVPPKRQFQVYWTDIDKIELKLKRYMRYGRKFGRKYIFIHQLNFIGKVYNQSFEILDGRDFSKKINEVFEILENYAIKMNKEFNRL
ncbi:MAG: hypothetical protein JSV23_05830 [Promethearchaeota archaeon]|nr:MAG: hypothetical protein JSV23_05830 [Candidatus Lokiarchaeota archaeon]